MSYRVLIGIIVLVTLVAPAGAWAQGNPATQGYTDADLVKWPPPPPSYTPPKTPWGDPEIQGTYDFLSRIPFERPDQYKGKAVFTDKEWDEWEKANPGNMQGYNDFWNNRDYIRDRRTSLVIDPPDGRIPPRTAEAEKKLDAYAAAMRAPGRGKYESWEDFRSISRCIAVNTPQGPMDYNSAVIIMQSPGWVVMVRERVDTRVIPMDGRPHLEDNMREWNGDSRGHWEGNTLVVDTTNYTPKQLGSGSRKPETEPGASAGANFVPNGISFGNFHLIEHFVPISPTRIHYYATLEDPTTWTKPWTFMLPWEKQDKYQMLEYGCLEGEISIGNALRGERMIEAKEKAAAEAAKKK